LEGPVQKNAGKESGCRKKKKSRGFPELLETFQIRDNAITRMKNRVFFSKGKGKIWDKATILFLR